jgi:hypothetical protein
VGKRMEISHFFVRCIEVKNKEDAGFKNSNSTRAK